MTPTSFTRGALCGRLARHLSLATTATLMATLSHTALAQDECATAINLTSGVPAAFDTTVATPSADPPSDAQCANSSLDWGSSADVWFRLVASSSGVLSLTTCDLNSYDTSVALYKGSSCGSLVQVACNGDAPVSSSTSTCQQYFSAISGVTCVAGDVFYVRVGGYLGETGTGTLAVSIDPDSDSDGVPDPADNCPTVANANQSNLDGDAYGDACDGDIDGDGVGNDADGCPLYPAEPCPLVLGTECTSPGAGSYSANSDTAVVNEQADNCGVGGPGGGNVAQAWARVIPAGTISGQIHCISFGLAAMRNTGSVVASDMPLPGRIGIYRDTDGGAPTQVQETPGDGGDLVQIFTTDFLAPGGNLKRTVTLDTPICMESFADSNLVVLLEAPGLVYGYSVNGATYIPPSSGYSIFAAGNTAGPSVPTYVRSLCGGPQFVVSENASRWVVEINGNLTECGGGGDADSDGVPDASDNCPNVANADQANMDGDAYGDACDDDRDGDGMPNATDGCPDNPYATAPVAWYRDRDGDLFGDPAVFLIACLQPSGYIPKINTDCDDSSSLINPNGVEVCDSADADEDCDGLRDDADPSVLDSSKSNFYVDADNDNYGAGAAVRFCDEPALHAPVAGDCNNSNAAINPGAAEACDLIDNNCNGQNNEGLAFSLWYADADSDTYGAGDGYSWCAATAAYPSASNADCNDGNPAIRPGASETCDGFDNNCASGIDEGFPNFDGDSYADCVDPDIDNDGSLNGPDCNDFDASIRPGAADICDGYDNDCDNYIDDADSGVSGAPTWYLDADGDGYGTPSTSLQRCVQPANHVANSGDACDADPDLQSPVAWYRDQDIDGQGDPGQSTQACDAPTGYVASDTDLCPNTQWVYAPLPFYRDQDGDGFGDSAQSQSGCTAPAGYVANDDDGCPDVYELQSPRTWYGDSDGDSYGDPSATQSGCVAPAGFVGNSDDGCPDEPLLSAPLSYFIDGDRDGYGSSATAMLCATSASDGYSSVSGDCDDGVAGIVTARRYYADGDGDGAGDPDSYTDVCQLAPPSGYVAAAGDTCDDDPLKTAPGDCGCGTPDSDDDNDGVSDCIDSTPALRLVARGGGQFIGSPIVIDVTVGTQIEPSVGAQLALHFDTSRLAFVSMVAGGGTTFAQEIVEMVNGTAGTILYAVGESVAGGGSTSAATVATITFELAEGVEEVCSTSDLVRFGTVGGSSSRLASPAGTAIVPTTIDLGAITASSSALGLLGVPDSWSRPADAGVAGSAFEDPAVTANLPCGMDPAVAVSVTYPAGHSPATGSSWPAGGVFPVGTTTVTWTASVDGVVGGSVFSETREFTVLNHAVMDVTVSMPGTMVAAHQRTIQYSIGGGPWQVAGPMTIAPFGSGTGVQGRGSVTVEVPVNTTSDSCILLRDAAHTVARSGSPVASGTAWTIAVTLVQGDSNADNHVDILDYAILLLDQMSNPVARDARSNFNGDTVINSTDFSFISSGFFAIGDTCTDGGAASGGALERISVAELRKRGDGELAAADLNGDGWVDLEDMALWMHGARPESHAGSPDGAGSAAE